MLDSFIYNYQVCNLNQNFLLLIIYMIKLDLSNLSNPFPPFPFHSRSFRNSNGQLFLLTFSSLIKLVFNIATVCHQPFLTFTVQKVILDNLKIKNNNGLNTLVLKIDTTNCPISPILMILQYQQLVMKRNQGLSEVIRYEQQLKAKIQQTQNAIHSAQRDKQSLRRLNEVIQQQDILLKYLQVESSKMNPEVKNLYTRNITRFKNKIKEHKEYANSFYGTGAIKKYNDKYQIGKTLHIQQNNNQLFQQKMAMYDNVNIQQNIGNNLHQQGNLLQQGIRRNQQIRQEAAQASDTIKLIQKSIFKRKIMFYSLFFMLVAAGVFIIIRKFSK